MSDLHKAKRAAKAKRVQYDTSKSLKEAMARIQELEAHTEAIKRLTHATRVVPIKATFGKGRSEAVAIACGTDWHVGAVVEAKNVSGLNEFDIAIAKKRIASFFTRIVKMAMKERHDVEIKELVLFLGGDLIDGALHLDCIMANEISEPMHQAVICQEAIQAGLDFLKKHGGFKKITVVCTDGNHGRITARQHWGSRQGNALEYFLYYNLAQRNPDLTWIIANGIHVYLPVYDNILRFMHGDTIGFGGVNGPYTYLNRRIYQWDQARRADFTLQGHLHSYCLGGRRWLINGSLIGYNDYSVSLGAEMQPPIQAFLLWDKKRGPTVNIPLLVGDGEM